MKTSTMVSTLLSCFSIAPAIASPTYGTMLDLKARDVFVPLDSTCDPLVYGATSIPFGTVCTGIEDGVMTVQYDLDAGWGPTSVHMVVGTAVPTLAVPGQMPYTSGNGFCTLSGSGATCKIPMKDQWRGCDTTLHIATHISATSSAGAAVTGWGKGPCYDSKGNCAKSWTFQQTCRCPAIYKYEPITTVKTFITTITTSEKYTVTFPPFTTTQACNDPSPATVTAVYTTTTSLPEGWTVPERR